MTNEDEIQLLKIELMMQRIRTLQNELNENPQYSQDFVESITADIQYYQNQIEFIVNQS
jgi:t-SNARE complex subunit (syntaxin)